MPYFKLKNQLGTKCQNKEMVTNDSIKYTPSYEQTHEFSECKFLSILKNIKYLGKCNLASLAKFGICQIFVKNW
jgi:hypothetical protein